MNKLLQFLRITDEQGQLSLTNIIMIIVLIKILLKQDAIGTTDLGAILTAILGYQGKRAINGVIKSKAVKKSPHITLKQLFQRNKLSEVDGAVISEAEKTVKRVNKLLSMLPNDLDEVTVTSGYRDPFYNRKIGGATNSAHTLGMAVDLSDVDGAIKGAIDEEMLEECGLYMEHPGSTETWCHLQTRPTKRRIFYP